jgi:hypothetical protein
LVQRVDGNLSGGMGFRLKKVNRRFCKGGKGGLAGAARSGGHDELVRDG